MRTHSTSLLPQWIRKGPRSVYTLALSELPFIAAATVWIDSANARARNDTQPKENSTRQRRHSKTLVPCAARRPSSRARDPPPEVRGVLDGLRDEFGGLLRRLVGPDGLVHHDGSGRLAALLCLCARARSKVRGRAAWRETGRGRRQPSPLPRAPSDNIRFFAPEPGSMSGQRVILAVCVCVAHADVVAVCMRISESRMLPERRVLRIACRVPVDTYGARIAQWLYPPD